MSKYIDADRLKNGIMQYADKYGGISCSVTAFNILLERFAADVQEVKHGQWIVEHGVLAGDGIYGDMGKCSVCGVRLRDYEWNYCPNCGAKMDEVEE